MRASGVTLFCGAALVAACGLDAMGSLSDPTLPGPTRDATVETEGPLAEDGGADAIVDSSAVLDATFDVVPLPADAGAPAIYAVSGRSWTYRPDNGNWSGGTQFPSGGCPVLDDLAADVNGTVYATGNGATQLFRYDPVAISCVPIGGTGTYTTSLGFAPRGTIDPIADVLVGYRANGDYVRIDTTTGAVVVVTAGAAQGRAIADVVNVGLEGFVAVGSGNGCGATACLWRISLATGQLLTAAPIGAYPATRPVTALAHWGGQIFAFTDDDEIWRSTPTNPGGATSVSGHPSFFDVAYRGAASRVNAPTQ
jgi:hypothetical protein